MSDGVRWLASARIKLPFWIAQIARLPLLQFLGDIVGGLTSKPWRKIAYSEPGSSMTLRAGEQPSAVIAVQKECSTTIRRRCTSLCQIRLFGHWKAGEIVRDRLALDGSQHAA
jgi:hypothetical protein